MAQEISNKWSIVEDSFEFLPTVADRTTFLIGFHYLRGLIDAEWMLGPLSGEAHERYERQTARLQQMEQNWLEKHGITA